MTLQHDPVRGLEPVMAVPKQGDEGPPGEPVVALAIAPPAATAPPAPAGWSDTLTGVDGPRYWDRVVLSETARARRYKRPACVVFAEVRGLAGLGRLWGPDVAERALINMARTLEREIRSSDHVARVEAARFAILLTETDEIAAINFVERARASCEREVGSVALESVRLCFGWASPPAEGDLGTAIDVALDRLRAELAAG